MSLEAARCIWQLTCRRSSLTRHAHQDAVQQEQSQGAACQTINAQGWQNHSVNHCGASAHTSCLPRMSQIWHHVILEPSRLSVMMVHRVGGLEESKYHTPACSSRWLIRLCSCQQAGTVNGFATLMHGYDDPTVRLLL